MRLVLIPMFFLMFTTINVQAQDYFLDASKEEFHLSILEHIQTKNEEVLNALDSIKKVNNSEAPVTDEDIEIYKRCVLMSKTIPLDYNDKVKSYIDKYTSKNYRPYMNRLLGLSQHYFPIYESVFNEVNLPEEIKYLSLVESSLNPHLVSSAGAVGPWQFIHVAAKEFDLEMSSNYDERKDAYSSTYAVSQYLEDAYSQFGDWLVALASYNCGRGCVRRAIAKSGIENPTFWELEKYLPKETRNYIPKYIAMTYVLSDPEYYGIEAQQDTELNLEHNALLVDKKIDLTNVAKAVGVPLDDFKKFNPSFKYNTVYGSVEKPKRLLIPITPALNDSLLYLALNDSRSLKYESSEDDVKIAEYKVKKGETLSSVSRKFGISTHNLKAWNGLTSRSAIVGKTLIVEKPINEKLSKNLNTVVDSKKSATNTFVYTVKKGDSLDRIASRHKGVTVSKLKADNGLKNDLIKPGMKLKVKRGKG